MQETLEELMAIDGTKKLAIKRAFIAEVTRRRRNQRLLDWIALWESEDEPIDQAHLNCADSVLDRQGVPR